MKGSLLSSKTLPSVTFSGGEIAMCNFHDYNISYISPQFDNNIKCHFSVISRFTKKSSGQSGRQLLIWPLSSIHFGLVGCKGVQGFWASTLIHLNL